MTEYFTGVGSRDVPDEIFNIMRDAGAYFCNKGYVLRSGAAEGSDSAFEFGCNKVKGKKEIYLPWKGFNDSDSHLFPENIDKWYEAMEIASKFHPHWDKMKQGAKKLHCRNCFQCLGKSLDNPSKFVLYYAKIDEYGNVKGGTAMAVKLAENYSIPNYNLYNEDIKKKFIRKIYSKGMESTT